jgi:xylan 1,4-beta-xylosidase
MMLALVIHVAGAGAGPTTSPAVRFQDLPVASVTVDLDRDEGPLELWRQGAGLGGVNSRPLPGRVSEGLARLRPRLIRVFIQEFFNIYPEHHRFDWSRLDPYMDALQKTGAHVVAAITIKPGPLFPQIDASVWRPNDVKEWQEVIAALVKRYSVDRHLVTYWEIGNETDIGEDGGCPYLIRDPKDYAEFYAMTVGPIVATFPQAKVGGPAVANAASDYLPKFLDLCRDDHLRLDFISWHVYSDNPDGHAELVEKFAKALEPFGKNRPEMLVTEWNKGFDPVSVEEMAFDPRRAANAAACILAMNDAKIDWSFYYHAWDQVCDPDEFKPFFKNPHIMYHHWNEVPHRFGLFGVNQEVRPQYFVFQMLSKMGDRRVAAECDAKDLRVLASRGKDSTSLLLVNFAIPHSQDRVATIYLRGLEPGRRRLTVLRIDREHSWSPDKLELIPTEKREVDVWETFSFQLYCPADSVALVELGTRP